MSEKEERSKSDEFKKLGFSNSVIEDGTVLPFFKNLVDSIPHLLLVVRTDKNFSVVMVNKVFAKSAGRPEEELIDVPAIKLFQDESVIRHRKQYADEAYKQKKVVYWLDKRENKVFSNSIFPLFDRDRNVPYLVMMARDITKRKEEEEMRLKAKEQYFLSLIEFSNDIFTVVDSKGTVKFSSSSLKRILGNVPSKRRNQNIFENIHPEDRDAAINFFKKVLVDPSIHDSFIYRIKDVWGNYRFLESSCSNQLKNPAFEGIIINSRDVTERESDRLQLFKQKNYLEDTVNGVNEVVFTINDENKVVLWNSSAQNISHFSPHHVVNKSIDALDVFEDASALVEFLSKKRAGKKASLQHISVFTRKGEKRLWKPSVSFLELNNRRTDAIFICQDITFSQQIHSKLVPGSSYIVFDGNVEVSSKVFSGLLHDGRVGLFISREKTIEAADFSKKVSVSVLVEEEQDNSISSLEELHELVLKFISTNKKSVVLIDRLDYFIIRFSFEKTLQMLYRLNGMIQQSKSLLMLRINPGVISELERGFLEEEFLPLPSRSSEDIALDKEVFEILLYIDEENKSGKKVAQKDICEHFKISKVTAQKRLDELRLMHLVGVKKEGRFKYLHVLDGGLALIYERDAL